ncbi:hypothetical protein PVAP13_1KG453305 [Panicum virgatum]|uniref:Uncharacterized protein n=1 Tax=Panicum virgatum TaxID=38727 RepID=A0A8T0XM51_PANVG|nr:hypothetical protein PVAP13_1KG453305 [Panicum virgatum]
MTREAARSPKPSTGGRRCAARPGRRRRWPIAGVVGAGNRRTDARGARGQLLRGARRGPGEEVRAPPVGGRSSCWEADLRWHGGEIRRVICQSAAAAARHEERPAGRGRLWVGGWRPVRLLSLAGGGRRERRRRLLPWLRLRPLAVSNPHRQLGTPTCMPLLFYASIDRSMARTPTRRLDVRISSG